MTPSGIDPATFGFVVQWLKYCATAYLQYVASEVEYLNTEIVAITKHYVFSNNL
jgi:hypothetical protein